jgi:hypothetical protein
VRDRREGAKELRRGRYLGGSCSWSLSRETLRPAEFVPSIFIGHSAYIGLGEECDQKRGEGL